MLFSGIILFIAFIGIEWRLVELPILPSKSCTKEQNSGPCHIISNINFEVHLFKLNRSTNILLAMNIGIGWVFWGNLFYIPLYFQTVRGMSPATAGSVILPMVIAHGITSGVSGIITAYFGRYKPVICTGAALWAIGAMVKSTYGQNTPVHWFFIVGIFEGIGVGCGLQPGMKFVSSSQSVHLKSTNCKHSFGWPPCRI